MAARGIETQPWPPPPPTMAPAKRTAFFAGGGLLLLVGVVMVLIALVNLRTPGGSATCGFALIGAVLIGVSILLLIAAAAKLDLKL